MGDTAEDTLM